MDVAAPFEVHDIALFPKDVADEGLIFGLCAFKYFLGACKRALPRSLVITHLFPLNLVCSCDFFQD